MKIYKVIMIVSFLIASNSTYAAFINFNNYTPSGYGGQFSTGAATASTDGLALDMNGNLWVSLLENINVDNSTTLYFDFIATGAQAELYGIGFDNDNVNNNFDQLFIFGGSQIGTTQFPSGANVIGNYQAGDGSVNMAINVGAFLSGANFSRLIFILDNDAEENVSLASFSNFEICSDGDVCQSLVQVSEPGYSLLLLLSCLLFARRMRK